ncbi:MAG: DNA integrity scanning protein DisA nucleotide-binding domain protein [Christensenellaceae bacterium]|jgi:diadenylate cyclase|nr:DNA integrity scanning protein DisA nucleotide-binding domain protein [Christensenellaceae bacterium]
MTPATAITSFTLYNIIDLALALIAIVAITVFFVNRRVPRLLVLYLGLFFLFLGVSAANVFVDIHIAVDIARLIMILGMVIFAVVYQNDLKTIYFGLSKQKNVSKATDDELRNCVTEIVKACQSFSKFRTGALIVVSPTVLDEQICATGTRIDALVSAPLLQSIFYNGTPVHDGAVMLKDNRIVSAGCFLPLTDKSDLNKALGTRHRAALGVSQDSDVTAIVVSEETGIISCAQKGVFKRFLTPERLTDILCEVYLIEKNVKEKLQR